MNHSLVDGMISMDVPAAPLLRMGATHVVSIAIPMPTEVVNPHNMRSVVTRCFQILNERTELQWRRRSKRRDFSRRADVGWNSFESAQNLVEARRPSGEGLLMRECGCSRRSWIILPP